MTNTFGLYLTVIMTEYFLSRDTNLDTLGVLICREVNRNRRLVSALIMRDMCLTS